METNFTLLQKYKNLKLNINDYEYFLMEKCDEYFELEFCSKNNCNHKFGCNCEFDIMSVNGNGTEYKETPDYFYPHRYYLNFDETYYIYFDKKKIITISPSKQWDNGILNVLIPFL